jgi:hypothetical protein
MKAPERVLVKIFAILIGDGLELDCRTESFGHSISVHGDVDQANFPNCRSLLALVSILTVFR